MKICWEIPNLVKIRQKYWSVYMKTYVCLILNCHKSILPVKWYQAVRIAEEVQILCTCATVSHYTYTACLVAWKHTRGKGFQVQIVTEDEIWIPYFESESKQQLMEWCHITAQNRKFKVVPSAGKSWLQFRGDWWTITTTEVRVLTFVKFVP